MKFQAVKETATTCLKKVRDFDPYVQPRPPPLSELCKGPDPQESRPTSRPEPPSTTRNSTPSAPATPAPQPRSILRRPSVHFAMYDDHGEPIKPGCDEIEENVDSRKELTHDKEPSKAQSSISSTPNTCPYPDSIRNRHSERKLSYVPPDWKPGMKEPTIHGRITYVTVNNPRIPDRYYRGPSATAFPHPELKCIYQTLQVTLKRDHKRMIDHLDPKEIMSGEYWDQEEQDGLTDYQRRKESKYLVQQAQRDRRLEQRKYRKFHCMLTSLVIFSQVFPRRLSWPSQSSV